MPTKKLKPKRKPKKKAKAAPRSSKRRCGLCGKTGKLIKTACCGQWICDDTDKYVMFSYARNSCDRNHDRYTLCGNHSTEEHSGRWQDCASCRDQFETEMYVWYGTNEYNFEKLKNPPHYEPTKCVQCGAVISLSQDGYAMSKDGYRCENCYGMPS